MGERPSILLSCGMSIDRYINAASEDRLLLSNDADFDRVDAVRASCDAIPAGETEKIVYCASTAVTDALNRFGDVATVVDAGEPVDLHRLTADLHARGVRPLMVDGGGSVHTQLLAEGFADELHLVAAPFFVGDSRACRFVGDGSFPWNPDHRATLTEVRQIGDVVLPRYAMSDRIGRWHE